jgi:hypothetical protein
MEQLDRVLKGIMALGVAAAIALAVLIVVALAHRHDTSAQPSGGHHVTTGLRATPVPSAQAVGPALAPPARCARKGESCALALLTLINRDREAHHRPPLVYDTRQSTGVPEQSGAQSCAGSSGHSLAMAESNRLWHRDSRFRSASYPRDICGPVARSAENVGAARGSSEWDALRTIEAHILGGGPGSRPLRHLLSPRFTRVGVGIARRGNKFFVTEDFLG